MPAYAELAVTTNFSFLRGASHPKEMVETADDLGLSAIGIADRNSFAGVVRAYGEWKERTEFEWQTFKKRRRSGIKEARRRTIKLLVGVRLVTIDGFEVIAYPTDRIAYGRLSRLLTACKLKEGVKKDECRLTVEEIVAASEGQIFIALPPDQPNSDFSSRLSTFARAASGRDFPGRRASLSWRRAAPARALARSGWARRRAARRHQRRALPRSRAPRARRRGHLHPRESARFRKQAFVSPPMRNGISRRPGK